LDHQYAIDDSQKFFLTICFLGGTILAAYGGWNYIWGRINFGNETIKAERLKAKGYTEYDSKSCFKKLKKKKPTLLLCLRPERY
jgi:hypothetical protein